MKILILSHHFYPDVGGIEVNSEVLSGEFHKAGHQVRLLTWTKEKGAREFPFEVIRNPGQYLLIKQHLWADIIFENNLCLRLSWPRVLVNKPSVVAIRTWINRVNGDTAWQDRFKMAWLKQSSAVIAVSNAVRRKCWHQAVVIGNPYRSGLFEIKTDALERRLDFVFVGRLVSDKGVDLAIKGLRKFIDLKRQADPAFETSLTIIGEGPEEECLKTLAEELHLADNIHFRGLLRGQELVSSLNEHRFLLVPSVWEEPFGNVVLEGMGCGLIPIVSSGGGLSDAAGPGGLVFESGNVDSLVAHMESIYEDALEQHLLRMKATEHLLNHQPHIVAARYLHVFQKAVSL